MVDWKLKSIPPSQFAAQRAQRRPAGYVCLILDVDYHRYQILRLQDPKDLSERQAFETEVVLVFQTKKAAAFERYLLEEYAGGEGQGGWFDLDAGQLRRIKDLARPAGRAPRRRPPRPNRLPQVSGPPPARPNLPPQVSSPSPARPNLRPPQVSSPSPARPNPRPPQVSSPPPARPHRHLPVRRNRHFSWLTGCIIFLIIGSAVSLYMDDSGTARRRAARTLPQPTATPIALAQPVLSVAHRGQNSIRFKWRTVPGAQEYQYRYAVNGGAYSDWRTVFSRSNTISKLTAGDQITFQLRAKQGDNLSSAAHLTVRLLPQPELRVGATNYTSIRFDWHYMPGGTQYQYRYAVNGGAYSDWRTVSRRSVTVPKLTAGDQVTFRLRAQRGDNLSPIAELTARTLPKPTAVPSDTPAPTAISTDRPAPTATRIVLAQPEVLVGWARQTSIGFYWDTVPGAEQYQYRYAINNGPYTDWRTVSGLAATVSGLSPRDGLAFQVRAKQGENLSTFAHLTTRALSAPTATLVVLAKPELRVGATNHTSIRFNWDSVPGAANYQYRYAVNGGAYSDWRTVSRRATAVSNLSPSDSVDFQLRAKQGEKLSAFAHRTARALPKPTDMPTPTALPTDTPVPTATPTDTPAPTATPIVLAKPELRVGTTDQTHIQFIWSVVPGASQYQYRYSVNMRVYSAWTVSRRTVTILDLTAGDQVKFQVRAQQGEILSPIAVLTARTLPEPTATSPTLIIDTRDNATGVNVRACPETSCAILGGLKPGDEIQPLATVEGEAVYGSAAWIQFRHGDKIAYVHSELVAAKN